MELNEVDTTGVLFYINVAENVNYKMASFSKIPKEVGYVILDDGGDA